MELMIKGTSALVSVPSQWVKQVAPLPEEEGGRTQVIPDENPGREPHLVLSLHVASSLGSLKEERIETSVLPRQPFGPGPQGATMQTREKVRRPGVRRDPGTLRRRL